MYRQESTTSLGALTRPLSRVGLTVAPPRGVPALIRPISFMAPSVVKFQASAPNTRVQKVISVEAGAPRSYAKVITMVPSIDPGAPPKVSVAAAANEPFPSGGGGAPMIPGSPGSSAAVPSDEMPSWVIPAAIGVALLLFMKH